MAKATKKEQEIIDAAMKRLKRCVDAEQHNRTMAVEDLKFVNGEQWDAGERKRRADKGRPALQFNMLQKFVDQVVGDMMHNSPQIKVRPVDSKADINIAKIRQGIISNIEYLSNSKAIYGYAARQQVSSGYGAWRILTRYTEENPFLQEAYLESVRNPFLVYMDPDCRDQNFADAKFGFVLEKMPLDAFKEKYPKASVPSNNIKHGAGLSSENWFDGDTITVAEYFSIEKETVTMLQLEDGDVVTEEEFKEMKADWKEKNANLIGRIGAAAVNPMPQQMSGTPGPPSLPGQPPAAAQGMTPPAPPLQPQPGMHQMPTPPMVVTPPQMVGLPQDLEKLGAEPRVAKRRDTEQTVIRHRILTCCEILDGGAEGSRFPGKFIPIIVVKGKELNIEGKNYIYSLIRHAKDPQKLYNYWQTSLAENIALAPKAPWLGTARQFEGYENDYAAANVENFPFLKYNPDPDAPGAPLRQAPAQPPAALFEQVRRCEESIKSTIGMFNADLGAPGPEQTGAAIMARQRPGDIGTYEFMENLSRAVLYTGRVLNEIIPEIYDTERDVRLRNIDESETFMPINTTVGNAMQSVKQKPEIFQGLDPSKLAQMAQKEGKEAKFNDITVGKYDVVVTTGPSYATQRQESAQHLLQLMQAAPQQMSTALDLVVRNLDFKESDELETRLRKPLVSAGIVAPKPGEQVTPLPPNPAMIQAQTQQAKMQAQVQLAQIKLQQETLRLEEQKLKLQAEMAKIETETGQKFDTTYLDMLEKDRRYQLESDRLNLEQNRFEHQRQMEGGRLAVDAADKLFNRNQGA